MTDQTNSAPVPATSFGPEEFGSVQLEMTLNKQLEHGERTVLLSLCDDFSGQSVHLTLSTKDARRMAKMLTDTATAIEAEILTTETSAPHSASR